MMLHQIWNAVTGTMTGWYEAKMFIEHASLVSSDALHLLAGTLVWLLAAFFLRKPVTRWLPWMILLALIAFNEIVDLWIERWPDLAMQYGETAKDLVLTMALPTVLMLTARARPQLFAAGNFRRTGR